MNKCFFKLIYSPLHSVTLKLYVLNTTLHYYDTIKFYIKWSTKMKYIFSIVFLLTLGLSSNKELFEVKENTSDKLVLRFKIDDYSISKKDNSEI